MRSPSIPSFVMFGHHHEGGNRIGPTTGALSKRAVHDEVPFSPFLLTVATTPLPVHPSLPTEHLAMKLPT